MNYIALYMSEEMRAEIEKLTAQLESEKEKVEQMNLRTANVIELYSCTKIEELKNETIGDQIRKWAEELCKHEHSN